MLHITNGDSTAESLCQIFPQDEVLPWRDVLHEGPVPQGQGLREVRARFLAGQGWVTFDAVHADLAHRDTTLDSAKGKVVLWFEHDLYDQLQLLDILDRLAPREDVQASLICIGEHPAVEPFHGLGQLTPTQLAALFPERRPVHAEQFQCAQIAWQAFRSPDPTHLQKLLESETASLPFLASSIRRHLEQFPGRKDGLSRSERQIMQDVANGIHQASELFLKSQAKEEAPFAGDSVFFAWMAALAQGDFPLLCLTTPAGCTAVQATVELTEKGRDILAGTADAISLRGIDRWLGGVHLAGRSVSWRWDEEANRLVSEA